MTQDAELRPRALCLSHEVSVAQEERQGGAARRLGHSEEQEASPGARADHHRELGPASQQPGVSAWAALTPPPPGLVLPVLKGCQDGCEFQVTGQGAPKLVGAVDGPQGPRRRTGRVLGRLPGVPGDLWVRWGRRGA